MRAATNRDWHQQPGRFEPLPLELPLEVPRPERRQRDDADAEEQGDRTGSHVVVIDLT